MQLCVNIDFSAVHATWFGIDRCDLYQQGEHPDLYLRLQLQKETSNVGDVGRGEKIVEVEKALRRLPASVCPNE